MLAVTKPGGQEVLHEVYEQPRGQFSEAELAHLTLAVAAINRWNRFNVAFRTPAGSYKSPIKQSAAE